MPTKKQTIMQGIVVRLYPSEEQEQIIQQSIGNARYLWNQYLGMLTERYKNNSSLPFPSSNKLKKLLPVMKEQDTFLKVSDASSLQYVVESLHDTYIDFFEKRRGHPNFKSKKSSKKSYTSKFSHNNIVVTDTHIKLPKLGILPAEWSSDIPFDRIIKATITHHPSGEYTASVLVEREIQALEKSGESIGLDMGQTDLMVGSNGYVAKTVRYKELERKLKMWQRKAARRARLAKKRGTPLSEAKNYQRAKQMVAKYHRKIHNCRMDYLHKETIRLVRKYDVIAVEDLKVKQVMNIPNRQLTKSDKRKNNHAIANQAWGIIQILLEYKCDWYGKAFVKVDPRYTTQDCSVCGNRTGPENDLRIRRWSCKDCGAKHNRDINAAKNILERGLNKLHAPVGV